MVHDYAEDLLQSIRIVAEYCYKDQHMGWINLEGAEIKHTDNNGHYPRFYLELPEPELINIHDIKNNEMKNVYEEEKYNDMTNTEDLVNKVMKKSNQDLPLKETEFDHCDYITRNNIRRADNVIFTEDSFKNTPHSIVPVVYDWKFGEFTDILGLAVLENRPEGVYAKVLFNNDSKSQIVKNIFIDNLDKYELSFSGNKINWIDDGIIVASAVIKLIHITPSTAAVIYDDGYSASDRKRFEDYMKEEMEEK